MKRFVFCILAIALLQGQTCTVGTGVVPDDTSGYRKVTLTGTVQTDFNEATLNLAPDEGLTVMEYAGEYSIELWFPMAGGEAVQQRCTIALSQGGYTASYYGTSTPCVYTPLGNAYEPRTFELQATLTVDGIYENDIIADELSIHLAQPLSDVIQVRIVCSGAPADIPDPATYSALSMYWYSTTWTIPIRVGETRTGSWDDWPLVPPYETYFVDTTQTKVEEIVASLE